jgi:hypothetical protein
MKFKVGDRVECFGTDEATKYFATGNQDPYRITGTVFRRYQHTGYNRYKVEIDNSGSQDSEGYNAFVTYHEMQMRKLRKKKKK